MELSQYGFRADWGEENPDFVRRFRVAFEMYVAEFSDRKLFAYSLQSVACISGAGRPGVSLEVRLAIPGLRLRHEGSYRCCCGEDCAKAQAPAVLCI